MCHVKVTLNRHKNASNLAGNSAAILWDYFQGGGMFTKIMKTCKIERLGAYCKGLCSRTGVFGHVFAKKSNTTNYLTSYILSYLNTYMIQIYKKIGPKGMKGSVLASDIWGSNPKLTFFAQNSPKN